MSHASDNDDFMLDGPWYEQDSGCWDDEEEDEEDDGWGVGWEAGKLDDDDEKTEDEA